MLGRGIQVIDKPPALVREEHWHRPDEAVRREGLGTPLVHEKGTRILLNITMLVSFSRNEPRSPPRRHY